MALTSASTRESRRDARHRTRDGTGDRTADPAAAGGTASSVPRSGTSAGWVPPPASSGVVAVTGSDLLRTEIERVASAAGRPVTLVSSADEPAASAVLGAAAVVLLGSDVALAGLHHHRDREGPDRPQAPWPGATIVVGLAGEGAALWDAAGHWGADRVAVVPEGSAWLVDLLGEVIGAPDGARTGARGGPRGAGALVGVIGGCGGVGATSVCVAVAAAARRLGVTCLLVDADPLGPGLDTLLDAADEPGLRWPDLSEAAGRIPGDHLGDAVPRAQGLPLLSGRVDAVPLRVREAVTAAAREVFSVTIVDVGRDRAAVRDWSRLLDLTVLVLPAWEAATHTPAAARGLDPERLLAVIAGTPPDGLDPELIAMAAGARHYVPWPRLATVGRRLRSGRPPTELVGRRCLAPEAILHAARWGAPR
ncbi:septum site-determining protein Ssd [Tersicoccus solisilvae]|nr:septum site-determining protein Ssd [Tersicoccus solisilvae]